MNHPMRRQDRQISLEAAQALLKSGEYGVISTVDSHNQPYGIPVSYVVYDGCIDFHSAMEGHKIDNFETCDQVSFCVVGNTEVLPSQFSTRYESVIVFGRISERHGAAKTKSLQALVDKYSPDFQKKGQQYIQSDQEKTKVYSISIDHITGKARSN